MTRKQSLGLIAMCWLLYVTSYMGRLSYNSNQLPIAIFYGATNTEVGLATSFFFFVYGAGQIVNGFLCKHYNVRYVLSGALIIASIINFLVFLGVPFHLIKFLWLINGIAQSVLWSSLLMTLSKNLDGKYIRLSIIVMSTTVSMGTFISYGLSALFATFNGFKFSFLAGAVAMTVSAILWFFLYGKITLKNQNETVKEENNDMQKQKVKSKAKMHPAVIYFFIVFGFFGIILNLMKDGLVGWVPKIMFDQFGLDQSLSILVTLLLPVLTIFGTAFVIALNKKIKDYTILMGALFVLATIMMLIVVLLFDSSLWYVVLFALAFTALLMSGANNIVTSMLPLELRDKANSGFVAGIINGLCYVGSTLSSVVLGAMADAFGWKPAFALFLGLAILVVLVAFSCALVKAINNKKKRTLSQIELSLDPDGAEGQN